MPISASHAAKVAKRDLDLRKVLADNVRALRQSKSLSQEALGVESGLHRTYIGSVERRERNISLSTLVRLAQALGVQVADLLTRRSRSGG